MIDLIIGNQKLNGIKLVIFDKDGTITDIHKYWSFMIKKRALYFSRLFPETSQYEIYNNLAQSMGLENEKKICHSGPVGLKPRNFIIQTVLDVLNTYDDTTTLLDVETGFNDVDLNIDTHFDEILEKLPGTDNLLNSLYHNCIVTIATTDITKRVKSAFEYLNINQYFDYIIGSDMVKNSKPSSEMVDLILKKYNHIKKGEITLIGDSMADLKMAKNAKIKFIGVTSGLYSSEFINNSEYIVNNLNEIEVIRK